MQDGRTSNTLIRHSAMATPENPSLPTLDGHVWNKGRYKVGGAKSNERCIPGLYVLAIVVADACGWSVKKVQDSCFTLREGSDPTLGLISLVASMSANKEVRRKKFC